MNSRISILLIAFVFVQTSLFADRQGDPTKADRNSKAYTDETIIPIVDSIRRANERIDSLTTNLARSANDILALKTEQAHLSELIEQVMKQAASASHNPDEMQEAGFNGSAPCRHHYPWELWLALVAFGVIVYMRTRGEDDATINQKRPLDSGSTLPKCPRCGQEHAPGDTICKNPNCKTQF